MVNRSLREKAAGFPEAPGVYFMKDGRGRVLSRWGDENSHEPGLFAAPHALAIDSRGDLYVGEVLDGDRIQKFIRQR